MKLGIYMGSFNPPHIGHISIVNYLLEKKIVDKVIIVPTLDYWDKKDLAPLKDRINMLNFFANDKIIIDEKHNSYVKTLELLEKMKKSYPNDTFYPIIGADNLLFFHKWYHYQKLLEYPFIVIPREKIDSKSYIQKLKGHFLLIEDFPIIKTSSTKIKEGLDTKYLDKQVKKYIDDNHLYNKECYEKKD